ncbi:MULTISPECIES: hypothetical protein [Nocardia]|uniref:Uncharacterized protein n=2 Tax=Nocardia TaxID=1817 RepID=A0A4R6PSM4_NOCIG|nr:MULTISPECIES: hypothetical protein [Nocardia]MCA2208334.1 hypothetical protein [Nocardia rosealba]NKX89611.1 hypothetical protein [Nocardia coubleae]TDP41502.1 hypothetical protein DFR75_101605 [Nocardia ignorata]
MSVRIEQEVGNGATGDRRVLETDDQRMFAFSETAGRVIENTKIHFREQSLNPERLTE